MNYSKDNVYIFGHKSPDTDTIASAVSYAYLKQQTGTPGAKAYRLGDINQETEFALNYFGVDTPELLEDVKQRVEDLEVYEPQTVKESDPVKTAWDIMRHGEGSRLVPITCENGKLKGIIGMADVTEIFMEAEGSDISRHEILYSNLIKILDGKHFGGEYKYPTVEGRVYVGGLPKDSRVCDKDIIICGNIEYAWKMYYEHDFGCIILTGGLEPKGFEGAKCAIVCVDAVAFTAVKLITQAISVRSLMNTENISTFYPHSYVDTLLDTMKNKRYRNFPVVNMDGTLMGILSRRHVMRVAGKKVIMVDHNERSQSIDGLDQAEIIEIIDHHRLADIQTDAPLYSRIEPVGCTCTIIYKMYRENGVEIPKPMAGMMLSAILSDTLSFSSPTCTSQDKAAAEALSEIAGVDIDDYGKEMFRAGTNLDKMSVEQMLNTDIKKFSFGKVNAYVAQINVMDFEGLMAREQEILTEMDKFYEANNCELLVFMVTDIVRNGSELFAAGSGRQLAEVAFGMEEGASRVFLPDVVSRKSQIIPKLTRAGVS
ncbi:MAG: putative manganese-dependent inorganic diphosphatase [Defluviitaleaceae bacterium]|nr:putative manganese-dependent inorganic diphosphatase [Defluviitaleaceae bacterium]